MGHTWAGGNQLSRVSRHHTAGPESAPAVRKLGWVDVLPTPARHGADRGPTGQGTIHGRGNRTARSVTRPGHPSTVSGWATVTGADEPQAASIWANSWPGAKTVTLCRAAKTLRTRVARIDRRRGGAERAARLTEDGADNRDVLPADALLGSEEIAARALESDPVFIPMMPSTPRSKSGL